MYLYVSDNVAYGLNYTSPQSERKIKPEEIKFSTHHKQILANDDSSKEFIKTETITNKFELPLDHFDALKNVRTILQTLL